MQLISRQRLRASAMAVHGLPALLALALPMPWALAAGVLVLASLAPVLRRPSPGYDRLRWFPGGGFLLLRADGGTMPAALLASHRFGPWLLTLNLATAGRRLRVRALRRGQDDAFRRLCCRLLSVHDPARPHAARRLRPGSVV